MIQQMQGVLPRQRREVDLHLGAGAVEANFTLLSGADAGVLALACKVQSGQKHAFVGHPDAVDVPVLGRSFSEPVVRLASDGALFPGDLVRAQVEIFFDLLDLLLCLAI